MTQLERELQQLAVTDWQKFKQLTGIDVDRLTLSANICTQRQKGHSLRQIANNLKTTVKVVRTACQNCAQ